MFHVIHIGLVSNLVQNNIFHILFVQVETLPNLIIMFFCFVLLMLDELNSVFFANIALTMVPQVGHQILDMYVALPFFYFVNLFPF
jgi:hypothetical protein